MDDRYAIPLLRPLLPKAVDLLPYLERIDASRTYTNHGPLLREFEARLAGHLSLTGCEVAAASSGTSALGAAISTVALPAGEHPLAVIPAFTFGATALAAQSCGYCPYLVDVDRNSWALEPDILIENPILRSAGVVVPVAPLGRAVPVDKWTAFSKRTGIPVVIDAAGSIAQIQSQPERLVGGFPVVVSLHTTKGLSTGEGGVILCRNEEVTRHCVQALNFGCYGSREVRSYGTNGKMSEYHAAIGLAELDGWQQKRTLFLDVAGAYTWSAERHGIGGLIRLTPDVGISYAVLDCETPERAAAVWALLDTERIATRFWYGSGMHCHAHFRSLDRDPLPNTEHVAATLLGLPMAPDLAAESIETVVAAIARALRPVAA